jgi:uncharacterized protein (DUF1697 family)
MAVLRRAFETLGFANVAHALCPRTILASGNVLFEADSTDEGILERGIARALPQAVGFESNVTVRTVGDLHKLVRLNPFQEIQMTPHTRSSVTFAKEHKTDLRFLAEGKGYTILGVLDGIVCSVVDLSATRTPDLMRVLDREFGKGVTTRSWNDGAPRG